MDYEAKRYSLHYLQTKERQEVNFALVQGDKVEKIIEAKHADTSISPALHYFQEKYKFPAFQVVQELRRERTDHSIEISSGETVLSSLMV